MPDDYKEPPKKEKVIIMKADYSLKNRIGNLLSLDKILHEQVISKAEKKVAKNIEYLSEVYDSLLSHYVFYLRGACNELKSDGSDKEQCLKDIQQTALSIKSSALLFGYELADKFATSLYLFIPKIRNFDENLYIIIESYTSCMEIIVSRKITTMETVTALKLLKIFAEISDKEKSLYS
jgi:hypothetical protein